MKKEQQEDQLDSVESTFIEPSIEHESKIQNLTEQLHEQKVVFLY